MRSDIVPGAKFPDYELSDHSRKRRKLSELQGQDPLVLALARGASCPKDRRQHEGLLQLHRELEVGYCRLAPISTDNITETNEFRTGVRAHWPFLSDPGRKNQKDLDIAEYTDPGHNPMIPHTYRARARSGDLQDLHGRLVFRSADDGRIASGFASGDKEMPTRLGHHNVRNESGMAAGAKGSFLSVRQNVRANQRRTELGIEKSRRHTQ
jgi:peroxiredoxin